MSNKAAVVEQVGSPVVIKTMERYTPGPDEILVKNKVISFLPVEAKMQKYAVIPYSLPAILGFSSAGTVEAVGSNVSYVKPGDRVAVQAPFQVTDPRVGHYQEYYIAFPRYTSKLPDSVLLEDAAAVPPNLITVIAVMDALGGSERPSPSGKKAAPNNKKLLVYSGSSSVGGYAIRYATDLGYTVITTSSPQNWDFVASLGASSIVDHKQPAEKIISDLEALGPFDAVFDSIGTPEATSIICKVLSQTGSDATIFTMLPMYGDIAAYEMPENVKRVYESWPNVMEREDKKELSEWAHHEYIPGGLESGAIVPTRNVEVPGGIEGIQAILDKVLEGGVSGKRLFTYV